MATPRKRPEDKLKVGAKSKYRPEYCKALHDALREGLTYTAFGARVGVCPDTLYEWEKRYPEFAEARKTGRGLSEEYYIGLLQSLARGDFGEARTSAACAIFLTKNVCNWKDTRDIAHSGQGGGPIDVAHHVLTKDERAARVAELDRLAMSRQECGHD